MRLRCWFGAMRHCPSQPVIGVSIQISDRSYTSAFSRHDLPEVCISLSLKNEGAGNAGCALHPRSRVQNAREKAHTSIQGSGEHPTFPAQWLYGLSRALPGVSGFSRLRRLAEYWHIRARSGRLPSARLDANHRGVRTTRFRRTLRHRSSARPKDRSRSLSRPAIPFRARCRRVHRIPSQRLVTMANAPSLGTGWRESVKVICPTGKAKSYPTG